eukprot:3196538-Amphidinium_carterae.1
MLLEVVGMHGILILLVLSVQCASYARPAGNLTRWRFAAEAYPKVLRWLQFNQSFRCRIEEIPQWVLLRVSG